MDRHAAGWPEIPEAHKVFDEVVITVKSGRGGNGEVVPADRGRYVSNHKYKPGGNMSKQIWLPASDPGDGADGGDVVLVCDPGVDSLLHLHAGQRGLQQQQAGKGGKAGKAGGGGGGGRAGAGGQPAFSAPDGSNANPNTGSGGPKRNAEIKKARTPCLEIPVPPGTVVKRKGTGALLGELLQPGQRLTVARGGAGGHGVVAPSRQQRQARLSRAEREARAKGVEVVAVEDDEWLEDSRGQPGQQLSLSLLLRVVADVGLVGFPNAGKSSLLKALTRASPTIAPYPFTTLMPNLGVLSAGGGANKAVLADLPGLIEGAHKGRGLGRNFLRHLRRTRALLHVVDASAPDPATDYYAVREELRMYNPDYCARPHVVALNKLDLLPPGSAQPEGPGRPAEVPPQVASLIAALREAATRQAAEHAQHSYEGPVPRPPLAIVPCSAATGEGLKELAAALQRAIGASHVAEPDILRPAPDTLADARGGPAGAAAAAVAGTAAAAAAVSHSTSEARRGAPPPPPAGWDEQAAGAAAAGGSDDGGWGGGFDDAAGELSPAELEEFYARARAGGLLDGQGNFTGAPSPDQAEEERPTQAHAAPPGEGDQDFLDSLAASGEDEWVELSELDEATLAAVLAELEAEAVGEGEGLLDPARDIMLREEDDDGDEGVMEAGGEATTGEEEQEVAEKEAEANLEEEDVRMAPPDDPDAALLALSTEELLALEKDW
ncbi:hypothetical protein GPECTOR_18g95 [Gonium pectorale]|uniref:OBG-type G domain-containing protein n=1 Tax=Gonium pectorale TaxID=33097 RepID=A0A150GJY9_GONPE|nr:hypothetical protein GPECTOR_18g95 [Gonium pectorale]|eukprot:KXZ50121.1 hypothetical protein GPECTOR_18g95 [Gonium pectorale]